MAIPSNLSLTHDNITVLPLHRSLNPPTHDEAVRAVADVHILLLHPCHIKRHEHLHKHHGPTVFLSAQWTQRKPIDHPVLTFLPSGDSRKFTLGEAMHNKAAIRP